MFGFGSMQMIGVMAVAGGLLLGCAYVKGRVDGYALGAAKGVTAAIDQLEERGQINEAVRKVGVCDLIIELGGVCADRVD
jgi:predicted Kef-type K+ transport protein